MSCFKASDNESKVNNQINQDIKSKKNELSVLLLGAGQSGKSTIFKQIKIAYLNGFTEQECVEFRGSIYGNIIKAMKALIEASLKLEIAIVNPDNREKAAMIKEIKDEDLLSSDKIWNTKIGEAVKELWDDEGIQKTFERRNEFQLEDNTD
eukprot:gene10511-3033_t